MAILQILKYPNPMLKKKSLPVNDFNQSLETLFSDMAETMYQAPGIGLAGPQVGVLLRVIVVDIGRDPQNKDEPSKLYKIANPVIKERSGEIACEEGCLSVPGIREYVKRSEFIVVEGYDEFGNPLIIEANGLLAVCIQHEIDHLDGKLFIDRLSRLKRQLVKTKYKKLASQ